MSPTIFRTVRSGNFTTLQNALLRDKSISFRARGILAMILSNVDEWQVHQSWLEEQGTEGREAIRSSMHELEKAGYSAYTERFHPVTGQFTGGCWTFYDTPLPPEKRTNRRERRMAAPTAGNPYDGKPYDGKAAAKKTMGKKTIKKENHKSEAGASSFSFDGGSEIDSPGSNGSAVNHESKQSNSRKSNSPAKSSMTPDEAEVMESWKRNYEITHHRAYLDNPGDLPAIRELLTAATPLFIDEQFTFAFLMHGDPRVWACTNRLVDLKTTVKNWNKITAEVAEHLGNPSMLNADRARIGEERLCWKTMHLRAVRTLQAQFGPDWLTAPDLVPFLCTQAALQQINPYFRCVLSPDREEVKKVHWEAAVEDYWSNCAGEAPMYLRENFWEIPPPPEDND